MVEKVGGSSMPTGNCSVSGVEHSESNSSIFVEETRNVKEKQQIKIDIAVKKAKLEKLKNQTYESYQSQRNVPSVLGGSLVGFWGGAALGLKIGSASLNPLGMAVGAVVGGIAGLFVGGLGGAAINDALTPEQQEYEANKANEIAQLEEEIAALEVSLSKTGVQI